MRSITLWRATLTSQARGVSGMLVADHCVSAAAKASCMASSAYLKSPTRRVRGASAPPASARNTVSMRFAPIDRSGFADRPDGTDLDRPVPGAWSLRRDRSRLVEILRLDHVVAAELLAGFGKRAVGGDGL